MKNFVSLMAAAAAAFALAGAGQAAIVTIGFSGTTTGSTIDGTDGSFDATFTFDDALWGTGHWGGGDQGYSFATGTLAFHSGTTTIIADAFPNGGSDPTWVSNAYSLDDNRWYDTLRVDLLSRDASGDVPTDGSGYDFTLSLTLPGNTLWSQLPTLPASISSSDIVYGDISIMSFSPSFTSYAGQIASAGAADPIEAPAVPEPAAWAMMLVGFGAVGGALRRRVSVRVA